MESTQKIRGEHVLKKLKRIFFGGRFFCGANFPKNRNFHEENITGRAGFVGPDPQFLGGLEVEKNRKFLIFSKCLQSVLKVYGGAENVIW